MNRQMFAKGGAAFPDYSGDGQITQKDILMGRGVIPMQEGGMAPMMPPQGMPPMMPPSGAMMGAASGVPEEQAEAMGAQTMDTGAMQGMLAQVADNLENLDEVEDYEQVMNVIRGDNATLEDRYDELSGVVGPEDARQTPESVLALVQPVMMMAAVDQGIGGLAAEEMTAPVEGAMAEGIMSTVAPPPPAEMAPSMPPAGMGGPPPVNFNQGGLVRRGDNQPVKYFANGGVDFDALTPYFGPQIGTTPKQLQDLRAKIDAASNTPAQSDGSRLRQLMDAQKEIYREYGLGDAASRAADLEEQKKLTQAQMLFDIAQTALTFAAPMQGERRGLSPAERLAMAASSTKLPQTIGARAQQQLELQKAAKKEERAVDLAALQSAETKLAAEVAAEQARDLQKLKNETTAVKASKPFVTTRQVTIGDKTYPAGQLLNLRPAQVARVEPDALKPWEKPGEGSAAKAYTVTKPVIYEGATLSVGDVINVTPDQATTIDGFETSTVPYKAPEKNGDVNIIFPDGSQQVMTPGTDPYLKAIKPVSEGGKGGLLSGSVPVTTKDAVNLNVPKEGGGTEVKAFEKNSPEYWKAIKDGATLRGAFDPKTAPLVNMRKGDDAKSVPEGSTEYYSLAQQGWTLGTATGEPKPETTKIVVNTKPITVNDVTVAPGTPIYLSDSQIAQVQEDNGVDALTKYEKAETPPDIFGSGSADKAAKYFATAEIDGVRALDLYAQGAKDDKMETFITLYTAGVPDARGLMQKRPLPEYVKQAIRTRLLNNPELTSPVPLQSLGFTSTEFAQLVPQDKPLVDPETNKVNIDVATADPTFVITGVDYTKSQGFTSGIQRFFNAVAGQASEIGIGSGYAGQAGKITARADKQLEQLAKDVIRLERSGLSGKLFALDMELLKDQVSGFRPSLFKTDVGALESLKVVRNTLARTYVETKMILDNPEEYSKADVGDARRLLPQLQNMIGETTGAILGYERFLGSSGVQNTSKTKDLDRG
jgi:hypothetical protein